jgi:tetratricopeptide (TPR) repeat protein
MNHIARSKLIATIVFATLMVCFSRSAGGERKPTARAQYVTDADAGVPIRAEADRPGLGQLHRDFGFPGAIRAWERGMYLNPRHRRYDYSYPSVYGPYFHDGVYGGYYGSYYSPGRDNRIYRDSYDGSRYESYSLRFDHAYDLGVAPAEIQDRIAAQAARSLTDYQDAMEAGYDAFRRARYGQAARYFLLASQMNHGDPSSRLCAAHAQTAIGQYESAAGLVHRALDLQPKLAYLSVDIRDSYGRGQDFADHLAALSEAVDGSRSADLWFLLGYYHYNSGDPRLASSALRRANELNPDDRIIAGLAAVACQVAP